MTGNILVKTFAGLCCLLLSACAPQGIKTVKPVNRPEFHALMRNFQPLLKGNGIVDEEGAWYSPILSRLDAKSGQAGRLLLNRLSPAFRFPDMDPAQLPRSFLAMFTTEAVITTDEYSFTALQGSDRIYVSLLAVLDWNRDQRADWLVLCRITPTVLPGTSRDYYLLINDLESPLFMPQVLGMRDCRNNICENYRAVGDTQLFQDFCATDLMPGEAAVTAPPVVHQENPRSSGNGDLEEKRLSN